MPSGKMSDEGLSYEKTGASMGESARAVVAILQRICGCVVSLGRYSPRSKVCELISCEL